MYTFYALLKDAFKDKVRMLYTDTDFFFFSFLLKTSLTRSCAVLRCGKRSTSAMCPTTIYPVFTVWSTPERSAI